MVYAGILAHGTSPTAAECARMIPQLSATSIRRAMRWAGDERRLAPGLPGGAGIHATPTDRRHLGPRRSGLVGHDEPGDQPPRLAGAAGFPGGRRPPSASTATSRTAGASSTPSRSCSTSAGRVQPSRGVVRREKVETTQLAVDTHGYTDFAMGWLAAGLRSVSQAPGLKQRHLFAARREGARRDRCRVRGHHRYGADRRTLGQSGALAASVSSGHASAVTALARFGSAARGDPIYDAGSNWASCCARRSWPTTSSTRPSAASCAACSTAARRSMH